MISFGTINSKYGTFVCNSSYHVDNSTILEFTFVVDGGYFVSLLPNRCPPIIRDFILKELSYKSIINELLPHLVDYSYKRLDHMNQMITDIPIQIFEDLTSGASTQAMVGNPKVTFKLTYKKEI